ncbi:MAG: ABC transporter ATP-binding protein [Candidatus Omnitrophica bacterium]|nr:ABC transporter ATP-binding protein [Candidatus Omnitrophota bacterium]
MKYVLELSDLCVIYKSNNYLKKAIDQLSLNIAQGEVFGFLGPNGAGKTTTIKSIFNFLPATSGQIKIFGKPSCNQSLHARMGYMPEIANYYWYLTPRELLRMYAGFFGMKKDVTDKKIDSLLSLVDIQAEANVLLKNFSKGMMQKVSLAQSLINDPDFLVLDEPTSGLDPLARSKVRDIIKGLKAKGKTIFFSSHELSEVELVCDRIGILNKGNLVKTDKIAEILQQKGNNMSLERYFLDIITKDKA